MKRITIFRLTLLSALHATAAVAKSITCTYPQDLTFDVPMKLGGLHHGLHPMTYRYASTRPDDTVLRARPRRRASG